jgi:hypothetical protein
MKSHPAIKINHVWFHHIKTPKGNILQSKCFDQICGIAWLLTVTTAAGFYICKYIITKKGPWKIYREIKSTQRIEYTKRRVWSESFARYALIWLTLLDAGHGTMTLWIAGCSGGRQLAAPQPLVDNAKPIFRTSASTKVYHASGLPRAMTFTRRHSEATQLDFYVTGTLTSRLFHNDHPAG